MLEVLRFWFTKDLVYLDCGRLEGRYAECPTEIRQGQAVQALQFDTGRILPSEWSSHYSIEIQAHADDHGVTVQLGGAGQRLGASEPPR